MKRIANSLASGYYESITKPDGKQPYLISAGDGGVLSFAGLWDRWKSPETGERVTSRTIIVTHANRSVIYEFAMDRCYSSWEK